MNGPLRLVTGVPPPFATISRIPIFLDDVEQNETWGNNRSSKCPPGCHGHMCNILFRV